MIQSQLEVTTSIGCSIACTFCPQQEITSAYTGDRLLRYLAFCRLISTVPASVPIIFAGVSEPFLNKLTPNMMYYAHAKGHRIRVFTTLSGLSPRGAQWIIKLPFQQFVLHLPDACGNAHIPKTQEWMDTLAIILSGVKNISFMNMGESFVSDGSERIAKGTQPKLHGGGVMCYRHEIPDYIMLPNGDVCFCCQTKGLQAKVGSLYKNTYRELVAKHLDMSKQLRTMPDSICHYCSIAKPIWKYRTLKLFNKYITILKSFNCYLSL
jgi:hypothetical protein